MAEFARFRCILREEIIPLLEEYCYEDYAPLEKILGSSLVDAQKQRVRQDLFEPSNRSLLVSALLAPAPDIVTSVQALSSAAETVDEEAEENLEVTTGEQT